MTGRREKGLERQKGDCYSGTIKTKKGERTRSAVSTTHTYTRTLTPSLTETLNIPSFETSELNGWRLSVAVRKKTPPGAWSDNFLHSWESYTFDWMETTREILFSWYMSRSPQSHEHIQLRFYPKKLTFDMHVFYCWISARLEFKMFEFEMWQRAMRENYKMRHWWT